MDSNVSEFLKQIFGVSDDEDFAQISAEFREVLDDYLDLTKRVFGPAVDLKTIAILAVFHNRNRLSPFVPLAQGQAVFSKMHASDATYLRPGPCGRAKIRLVNGATAFVSPQDLVPIKTEFEADEADVPAPPAKKSRHKQPVGAGA